MAGQYHEVQACILNQNARKFFLPCAVHQFNLVLGDTAKKFYIGK